MICLLRKQWISLGAQIQENLDYANHMGEIKLVHTFERVQIREGMLTVTNFVTPKFGGHEESFNSALS